MYNISSNSSELVEGITISSIGLKVVDFVKDSEDSESQFANHYDSISLKILTSFFYIIELIGTLILFSFVYFERSGAAGYYRQSHYREVPQWEIFMEQELRFWPNG